MNNYQPISLPIKFTKKLLMEPEQIRSLIQQAANAWINSNADAFTCLFLPDGKFIMPNQCCVGTEKIRQVTADFVTAYDVKIDIKRTIIDGNQAVVEWHWQQTEKETGKTSQSDDAIVVDFQFGRISRWREYIDDTLPES